MTSALAPPDADRLGAVADALRDRPEELDGPGPVRLTTAAGVTAGRSPGARRPRSGSRARRARWSASRPPSPGAFAHLSAGFERCPEVLDRHRGA
ncbi:hypothetical protein [Streptomyces sp. NPDC019224]|uniref:hypothetical protein n=1 Tax=Streptomyces sp. NPDC019224 TaxID=3154484 RepID=UPI0033F0DD54